MVTQGLPLLIVGFIVVICGFITDRKLIGHFRYVLVALGVWLIFLAIAWYDVCGDFGLRWCDAGVLELR